MACNCVCPGCRDRLIAKKSPAKKVVEHFAHQGKECVHGLETAIHLAAKEAIKNAGKFLLPQVNLYWHDHFHWVINQKKYIKPEKVSDEVRFDNIVPDIVIEIGGRKLFVEVFYTHEVDAEKMSKIRKMGISTIEIDLSWMKSFNLDAIRKAVIDEEYTKRWLFSAKEVGVLREAISKAPETPYPPPGINCSMYASKDHREPSGGEFFYSDTCRNCRYFVDYKQGFKFFCFGGIRYYWEWVKKKNSLPVLR